MLPAPTRVRTLLPNYYKICSSLHFKALYVIITCLTSQVEPMQHKQVHAVLLENAVQKIRDPYFLLHCTVHAAVFNEIHSW